MTEVEKLQAVRAKLVELRRREAQKIIDGGELPTYAAGIQNTQQWLAAVDLAIEEEKKTVGVV